MTLVKQIPLDLDHAPSFESEDFIISGCNADAVAYLDNWQNWPSRVAALVGPPASGKSHLASIWACKTKALSYTPSLDLKNLPEGAILLVEDADSALGAGNKFTEEYLFHLYNWIREKKGFLLLTAQQHPNHWPVSLPDLQSRLATIQVCEIHQPDDEIFTLLLIKLFSDRQLPVEPDVINYTVPRLERSFYAAFQFVQKLDSMALTDKRKITIPLAKSCFEVLTAR